MRCVTIALKVRAVSSLNAPHARSNLMGAFFCGFGQENRAAALPRAVSLNAEAYLRNHPDFAQAHANPEQHFLSYGLLENRAFEFEQRKGTQKDLRELCDAAAAGPRALLCLITSDPAVCFT